MTFEMGDLVDIVIMDKHMGPGVVVNRLDGDTRWFHVRYEDTERSRPAIGTVHVSEMTMMVKRWDMFKEML